MSDQKSNEQVIFTGEQIVDNKDCPTIDYFNSTMVIEYRHYEKLRAENAILREGLRWISVGTAEPTRCALAVFSDADKVKDGQ